MLSVKKEKSMGGGTAPSALPPKLKPLGKGPVQINAVELGKGGGTLRWGLYDPLFFFVFLFSILHLFLPFFEAPPPKAREP